MGKSLAIGISLAVISFLVAYQFVEPAPPEHLVMATGSESGAYHAFGVELQERLADEGIVLELHTSAGSVENASLLATKAVDVALIQGGTPLPKAQPDGELRGLASLYYEPLWIFHRLDTNPRRLADISAQRLDLGEPGSGSWQLASDMMALNQISTDAFSTMPGDTAAAALVAGDLDVSFMVAGPQSPRVQKLLRTPEIDLVDLERASAYHLHHRHLSPLNLPAGAIDMAENLPPDSRAMVGVAAMLVAREDLHPAILDLMLIITQDLAAGAGLFHGAGEFPSAQHLSLTIHPAAARFHEHGASFLQRFLPFWAATLIDRLIIMLVPLVALVLPLMRLFPPVYRWRVRSRIYRWYEDLEQLEERLDQQDSNREILNAIDQLEAEVKRTETPLSYADELYHLRGHIELVRSRAAAAA